MIKDIENEKVEFERERALFEQQKTVFKERDNAMKPIRLSVRGKKMTIGLGTLTKDKNSTLAKIFTGNYPIHQDEKRYFIDCNPHHFTILLDWLLYGRVDDKDKNDLMKIAELFEFKSYTSRKHAVTQGEFTQIYNQRTNTRNQLVFNNLDLVD